MKASVFLDTNVVLYVLSADSEKADRAEALLGAGGAVSVQVLNEAVSVCERKLRMPWPEIDEFLGAVKQACRVTALTVETHELATRLARRNKLAFYDALICAAASLAGASRLYSEDMGHGQVVEGVRIVNPFR